MRAMMRAMHIISAAIRDVTLAILACRVGVRVAMGRMWHAGYPSDAHFQLRISGMSSPCRSM
jgi:hypothetical protein